MRSLNVKMNADECFGAFSVEHIHCWITHQVKESWIESNDEGQRRSEVVGHADGAERDVGTLPVEGEDDLDDGLSDRRQDWRPERMEHKFLFRESEKKDKEAIVRTQVTKLQIDWTG